MKLQNGYYRIQNLEDKYFKKHTIKNYINS